MSPPSNPVAAVSSLPARRRGASGTAFDWLRNEILSGRMRPGQALSENEIAQRLGVSRTPVREALLRLRNEGLLDVESKSGWFVRPIDFDKLEELYDLRVILEAASVQRLCTRAEPAPELDALKAVSARKCRSRASSPVACTARSPIRFAR